MTGPVFASLVAAVSILSAAEVIQRYPAPEARQGVAVGSDRFYAIDNSTIAAYDRRTGNRLARWTGDPGLFPHLNSCTVVEHDLVCANSNYPAVPMSSAVETFNAETLVHVSSHSLGPGTGSLTWIIRHDGSWWAGFANYDGKGGEPGRDHRWTTLVRYDDGFRRLGAWLFPHSVLSAFAPHSSSGGVWSSDGLLYVTGHDRPELYALELPDAGSTLLHVATVPIPTAGQAIAFDPHDPRRLWSIDRSRGQVVVTQLPIVRTNRRRPH